MAINPWQTPEHYYNFQPWLKAPVYYHDITTESLQRIAHTLGNCLLWVDNQGRLSVTLANGQSYTDYCSRDFAYYHAELSEVAAVLSLRGVDKLNLPKNVHFDK